MWGQHTWLRLTIWVRHLTVNFKFKERDDLISFTIVPHCQIKAVVYHAGIPNHIWEGWVCEITGSGVRFLRQRWALKMCWVSMRKDFWAAFRLKSQEHHICFIEFHWRWGHRPQKGSWCDAGVCEWTVAPFPFINWYSSPHLLWPWVRLTYPPPLLRHPQRVITKHCHVYHTSL